MLSQERTEAILRAHLEKQHGIRVEYGTTLKNFEQDAKGVTVGLASFIKDREHSTTLAVKWLIAADGPASKLPTFLNNRILHVAGSCRFLSQTRRNFIRWQYA